jgi:hypothetical protein
MGVEEFLIAAGLNSKPDGIKRGHGIALIRTDATA